MNKRNMLIWKMTECIQMFVQGFLYYRNSQNCFLLVIIFIITVHIFCFFTFLLWRCYKYERVVHFIYCWFNYMIHNITKFNIVFMFHLFLFLLQLIWPRLFPMVIRVSFLHFLILFLYYHLLSF